MLEWQNLDGSKLPEHKDRERQMKIITYYCLRVQDSSFSEL